MREQELSPNLPSLSTFISHIRVIILMNTKMILAAVALSLSLAACAKKEEAAPADAAAADGSAGSGCWTLLTADAAATDAADAAALRPRRRLPTSRRPQRPQQ